jgi:Domain of unknown function (DUF4902)
MRYEDTSSDRYVRIQASALSEVKLRHLVTEKDNTIAVPANMAAGAATTGFTEWVGTWRTATVSVGWDWGVVGGLVVLLSQKEIRTNIQLLSPDQSPMPAPLAQIHLFHWIESLPWRETAVNDLLRP